LAKIMFLHFFSCFVFDFSFRLKSVTLNFIDLVICTRETNNENINYCPSGGSFILSKFVENLNS
jgi:hypothetical protein